ncbi:MAG: hypothetical protein CMP07_06130 [Xanthomonadales bacterium]|nr:hypothetical protein [Xanthomonadales bacterium]|tara:strand:- start:1181 stop:1783 length:603 start_codon:yes stop_codon:yes gene_type:complete
MKNFLRRNFVLVLGISLPMLLIAALLLVHGISRLTATRPAYPVLYVSFENYFGPHFYDFDIDESGRLEIGFTLAEDADAASNRQPSDATLALFDARSDTLETFTLQAPGDAPRGRRVEVDPPEALAGLTFSDSTTAPDGYRLELAAYRGGGLLREIFGSGGRSRHHRLVDNGVSFRVPDIGGSTYAYHDAFVGWVIEGDE